MVRVSREKVDYAKGLFEQEVPVDTVFNQGEMIDVWRDARSWYGGRRDAVGVTLAAQDP